MNCPQTFRFLLLMCVRYRYKISIFLDFMYVK